LDLGPIKPSPKKLLFLGPQQQPPWPPPPKKKKKKGRRRMLFKVINTMIGLEVEFQSKPLYVLIISLLNHN